MSKLSLFEGV